MKRLISLVLVAALSFFSFMVYAEEPGNDNTGYLPSYLYGNLNFMNFQGLSSRSSGSGKQYYGYLYSSVQRLTYIANDYNGARRIFPASSSGTFSSFVVSLGRYVKNDPNPYYWSLTSGDCLAAPDYVYCLVFQCTNFLSVNISSNTGEVLSSGENYAFVRFPSGGVPQFTVSFPSIYLDSSSSANYIDVTAFSVQAVGPYSGSSSDFQEWLDNNYQGAVNPGQSGANQEIQDNVGQLEDFDNKIFTDVSDYTSQLDFGLGDWSEAAAGISYIGSIFMLIWDNSPTQVIVLSLMVGLCLLILGRGPRVAGEVRRHEERASRRKKGG